MRKQGLRWVFGAADPATDLTGLEAQLRLDAIRRAQTGLVADMDRIADAVYGRDN